MKRQAEAALADLDAARSEIEARVSAGLLSQVEGEQQLLAIEEERLAALQALAAALEAAARATGDPEKIAQAESYAAAVRDLGFAVEGARASLAAFGKTALDAGRDALTEFFDTGISGAKSFRDAFRDMALSIIADLRRMAAQLIATAIMRKIAGAFGGGGMVGGEGGEKKATGGILGGAGTGTSDSNLAWFSRGEYLVRAAVVREPGVLRHLEDLNRRGVRALAPTPVVIEAPAPRFAEGGLVDRSAATSEAASHGRPSRDRPRRGPRAAPTRDLRRPAHPGEGHQQEPPRDPLGPGDLIMWASGTATDYIDLLDQLDLFLTSYGTAFGLTYAGVGDGRLTEYRGGGAAVAQTFTITATSATTFTVVGSVTGSHADATVGAPYSNPRVGFTIVDGATAFQAGDVFTLSTAPKWTTLRRSLGSKVLATQVNTGNYAAQNLVDGKPDGDTNNYWRVDNPITIPQDIEITLYQTETIVQYQLAEFVNWYSPEDWTFDYWNGSAWVTLDSVAGFSGTTGVVYHLRHRLPGGRDPLPAPHHQAQVHDGHDAGGDPAACGPTGWTPPPGRWSGRRPATTGTARSTWGSSPSSAPTPTTSTGSCSASTGSWPRPTCGSSRGRTAASTSRSGTPPSPTGSSRTGGG